MNPPTCKIIPRNTYDIQIGDVVHPDFVLESNWNGLTRFVNKEGKHVIIGDREIVEKYLTPVQPFEANMLVATASLFPKT